MRFDQHELTLETEKFLTGLELFRKDIKEELELFRKEIKEEFATLKSSVRDDVGALKSSVKENIGRRLGRLEVAFLVASIIYILTNKDLQSVLANLLVKLVEVG